MNVRDDGVMCVVKEKYMLIEFLLFVQGFVVDFVIMDGVVYVVEGVDFEI